jgi:hypothetical protein
MNSDKKRDDESPAPRDHCPDRKQIAHPVESLPGQKAD